MDALSVLATHGRTRLLEALGRTVLSLKRSKLNNNKPNDQMATISCGLGRYPHKIRTLATDGARDLQLVQRVFIGEEVINPERASTRSDQQRAW